MDSSDSPLTPFERAFLERFFAETQGFYLSGGAALALHFGHRRSKDLDLFTRDEGAFRGGLATVPTVAKLVGGRLAVLTDALEFRRVVLTGPDGEEVRVDLVRDTAARTGPPPVRREGVTLDPPEEILANKICAILGRSELRDLVDLYFLEKAGYRVLDTLDAAIQKDGGLTPAALAWSIGAVPIDRPLDGMITPVSPEELREFARRLREGLWRIANDKAAGPGSAFPSR